VNGGRRHGCGSETADRLDFGRRQRSDHRDGPEDGYPQATTVSYVSDGLTIYFGCGEASQKARNLARNTKVSLTVTLTMRCSWLAELHEETGCPRRRWSTIRIALISRLFYNNMNEKEIHFYKWWYFITPCRHRFLVFRLDAQYNV
jgi:hypothetical protein